MVSLTFYGGVDEIGGNKILLKDKDIRIVLDFGQSFTCGEDCFTGWLSPRTINGLGDYFEFGLLPKIKGLYAREQLTFTSLPYAEPEIDAVFLSHAHFDHVNHIRFLHPEIPVYLGEGTKLFLEAMENTSSFCDYGEHQYHTFRTGKKIKIGSLVLEPIHVDHSIPAAYGFLIHTSSGTVVYSGDIRAHGPRKDMTEDFIQKTIESDPIAMICEGTRMVENEKRKNYSEYQVRNFSDEVVSSSDKIVFITRYSRDIDRFRSFYHVAINNNRQFVISPKTAYLIKLLERDGRLSLPNPLKDDNILVYYKRKKSGKFEETDYLLWERKFMNKMITFDSVHKNQAKLMMDLDFFQFAELIDIKPDSNSNFIYSMSEPFSEEDIEDRVMHNWLNHFNIQFHQLHASGHMNRKQINDMIKEIKPRKVFPIHTENQKLFCEDNENAQSIEYGKKYNL